MAGMGGDALEHQILEPLHFLSKFQDLLRLDAEPVQAAVHDDGIVHLHAGLSSGGVNGAGGVQIVDADDEIAHLGKLDDPDDGGVRGHGIGVHHVFRPVGGHGLGLVQGAAQEAGAAALRLQAGQLRALVGLDHGPDLLAVGGGGITVLLQIVLHVVEVQQNGRRVDLMNIHSGCPFFPYQIFLWDCWSGRQLSAYGGGIKGRSDRARIRRRKR